MDQADQQFNFVLSQGYIFILPSGCLVFIYLLVEVFRQGKGYDGILGGAFLANEVHVIFVFFS